MSLTGRWVSSNNSHSDQIPSLMLLPYTNSTLSMWGGFLQFQSMCFAKSMGPPANPLRSHLGLKCLFTTKTMPVKSRLPTASFFVLNLRSHPASNGIVSFPCFPTLCSSPHSRTRHMHRWSAELLFCLSAMLTSRIKTLKWYVRIGDMAYSGQDRLAQRETRKTRVCYREQLHTSSQ